MPETPSRLEITWPFIGRYTDLTRGVSFLFVFRATGVAEKAQLQNWRFGLVSEQTMRRIK
jgi:hypothetical protein